VVPDDEMGYQVYYTFGKDTHAMRKYQRMMYWMPKFKHINPWPIPKFLPKDPTELAKIALRRMAVDFENQLSTFWVSMGGG
jgi:signaling intermediate in Toll pathway protein